MTSRKVHSATAPAAIGIHRIRRAALGAKACLDLGLDLLDHQQPDRAVVAFTSNCKLDPAYCNDPAVMLLQGNASIARHGDREGHDVRKPSSSASLGCAGDQERACSNLGVVYRDGLGVAADPAQAITFLPEGVRRQRDRQRARRSGVVVRDGRRRADARRRGRRRHGGRAGGVRARVSARRFKVPRTSSPRSARTASSPTRAPRIRRRAPPATSTRARTSACCSITARAAPMMSPPAARC